MDASTLIGYFEGDARAIAQLRTDLARWRSGDADGQARARAGRVLLALRAQIPARGPGAKAWGEILAEFGLSQQQAWRLVDAAAKRAEAGAPKRKARQAKREQERATRYERRMVRLGRLHQGAASAPAIAAVGASLDRALGEIAQPASAGETVDFTARPSGEMAPITAPAVAGYVMPQSRAETTAAPDGEVSASEMTTRRLRLLEVD